MRIYNTFIRGSSVGSRALERDVTRAETHWKAPETGQHDGVCTELKGHGSYNSLYCVNTTRPRRLRNS
jgi:hypothetical protein